MKNFIKIYQTEWNEEFLKLSHYLKSELKEFEIEIFHVGSTSIPNLCAKPILDIDIVIKNKDLLTPISKKLEILGYISIGEQGISGRFAFKQLSFLIPFTSEHKTWQEHHLYVCFHDSLAFKNHILFKEALLNNQKLMEEYADLKKKLIAEKGMTREAYNKRKTKFITSVLQTQGLKEEEIQEIINANV